MKVSELIEALSKMNPDHEVVVPVVTRGHVGRSASIKTAFAGFDWDSGNVFLRTDVQLTELDPESVSAIIKSIQSSQSWHSMEMVRKLKAQIHTYCPHCQFVLDPVQAEKDKAIEKAVANRREGR